MIGTDFIAAARELNMKGLESFQFLQGDARPVVPIGKSGSGLGSMSNETANKAKRIKEELTKEKGR